MPDKVSLSQRKKISALLEKSQLQEAKSCLSGTPGTDSTEYRVWFALGNLAIELKLLEQAARCYRSSLGLQADFIDGYLQLGGVLRIQGDWEDSANQFRQVLKIQPDSVTANYNLGGVMAEMGNIDEAVVCYKKVIAKHPDHFYAINNLGNILRDQARLDEAIECFRKVVALSPQTEDVDFYTGTARTNGRQEVAVNPAHAVGHWNLGMALLLKGELEEGWREYEWRKLAGLDTRRFPQRPWDGSSLHGKTLLIYGEQGIGDEIMFASCFPDVIEQASHCILQCDPRLAPLFSRTFPTCTIIGAKSHAHRLDWLPEAPAYDVQISAGSLPQFLRNRCDDFPRRRRYLLSDADGVDEWRNHLDALGDGLKIGISWRGGALRQVQAARSISLDQWEPLLSVPGCHFINLQYGDSVAERAIIRQQFGVEIHDWEDADPLTNLDNFAAQISALDLVIAIDNSTVHLSGALGTPTWTLLPAMPDWRWFDCDGVSPWYPDMQLFRQSNLGRWQETMLAVAGRVRKLVME